MSNLDNNTLYHYGVKGMKWGVRKDRYKSMSKSQRQKTQKKFYDDHEDRIKRGGNLGGNIAGIAGGIAGGLLGGPSGAFAGGAIGGAAGSLIGMKTSISRINKEISNRGRRKVRKQLNKKYKNTGKRVADTPVAMLTADQAKKLGYDDGTRVTGKEASDFWKAYYAETQKKR